MRPLPGRQHHVALDGGASLQNWGTGRNPAKTKKMLYFFLELQPPPLWEIRAAPPHPTLYIVIVDGAGAKLAYFMAAELEIFEHSVSIQYY